MVDRYPVLLGDKTIGIAEVEKQGAQYRIECHIETEADRAGLVCKDGVYPLGSFVRKGSMWISISRIGSKIWNSSEPRFIACLEDRGGEFEGDVSRLRYAVYSVKEGRILIKTT